MSSMYSIYVLFNHLQLLWQTPPLIFFGAVTHCMAENECLLLVNAVFLTFRKPDQTCVQDRLVKGEPPDPVSGITSPHMSTTQLCPTAIASSILGTISLPTVRLTVREVLGGRSEWWTGPYTCPPLAL